MLLVEITIKGNEQKFSYQLFFLLHESRQRP